MRKIIFSTIAASFFALAAFSVTGNWKVNNEQSKIEFTGGNISGTIGGLVAEVIFDKDYPEEAKFTASLDVPSLATGFFIKTMHAKDALGADKFPLIKFKSTSVSKTPGGYQAKGDLTIKGVIKPTVISFTFEEKGNQGIFNGHFNITPKDFGIDRFGTPKQVAITLTVVATKG